MVVLRCGKEINIDKLNMSTGTSNAKINQTGMENISMNITDLDQILQPIKDSITTINNTLLFLRKLFDQKFEYLQTRINIIESRCAMNENILHLQARKIDDNEQYSRKQNLKLIGIEFKKKEDPPELM